METRLVSLFLIFICTACVAGKSINPVSDVVEINGYRLSLSNFESQCVLDYSKSGKETSITLMLTAPCYFTRKSNQQLKSFSYADAGVVSTLIVIGNPISKETRVTWNLKNNEICGEKAQGILIKKSSLHVTKKILEGGVMCPKIGLDEKDFWYLAH